MSLQPYVPPAMPRLTLMQRVLNATGVTKALARSLSLDTAYFSPGNPVSPQGPTNYQPRQLDYATGYNINIQPRVDEPISFWDLFALAENDNITRLLIETRKDQIAALTYDFMPAGDADSDDELTPDQEARIKACKLFFKSPDGEHTFDDWLRMLLEDLLVYDAPCVYVNDENPLRTRFQVVSGTTIARKIDEDGRTPDPPEVAYQQIVKGTVAADYTSDEMIYKPRNVRANRVYGMSPVQQIVMTVNLALRKQLSQLYYFSEGSVPDALVGVPETWTPQQIAQFQEYWDNLLAGNLQQKRHAQFVPGGMKVTMTKEAVLTDDADLWWTKIRCYAFSIPPTAFEAKTNRATAQTSKAAASEEGLAPLLNWVKSFIDICLQKHLGQTDLEFVWVQDDVMDPADQVSLLDTQLRSASITLNEHRKAMGREGYGPDGDEPMVYTASGPVLLKNIINPPAPGEPGGPPLPVAPGGGSGDGSKPPAAGGDKPGDQNAGQGDKGDAQARGHAQGGTQGSGKDKEAGRARLRLLKAAKTLYIHRPLINADEFLAWAADQGFGKTLTADDLHVTIAFSRDEVDWDAAGAAPDSIRVTTGRRKVEALGDKGAVVLKFRSIQLENRWQRLCDIGCSWDYPSYQPHVTITYQGSDIDLSEVEPFDGTLEFGPEVFSEVVDDWEKKITEQDTEVDKAVAVPFVLPGAHASRLGTTKTNKRPKVTGKRIASSPLNTKAVLAARKGIEEEVHDVFKSMASDVAKKIRNYKPGVTKAAGDDEDQDIDPSDLSAHLTVDISGLDAIATGDMDSFLSKLYNDAGLSTIGRIGAGEGEDLVNQVNTRALEYSRARSAELVGKKWVGGKLVDNPNAKWAITDSTRDLLNNAIYDGLDNGLGVDGLADAIEAMPDSEGVQAFSYGRARMIARTETIAAHAKGDMEGLRAGRSAGLNVQKEWFADAACCDDCAENMDEGPIDLDDVFPSGDSEPPAHPNCECSVNGYIPEEDEEEADDEDVDEKEDSAFITVRAVDPVGIAKFFRDNFWRIVKAFNPDQPRDDHGRWSSGGGDSSSEQSGGGKSASDLFQQYYDPTVTADQIIDSTPGAREALQAANDKLAQSTETVKLFSKDGVYTPEREALHQQIINSYLNDKTVAMTTPAEGEKPTMTILGGRGGSGKSYLTSEDGPVQGNGVDNDTHTVGNALYMNSDDIKGMLPEYQGWNAPLLHEEATDLFDKIDAQARDLGLNVVHDSTMKTTDTAMARLGAYQDADYNLEGHYMFAPPQQAATQALGRYMRGSARLSDEQRAAGATGRLVSPKYVLGSVTNEISFDKAKGMFSKWTIYKAGATGGGAPTLYAKGGK